MRKALTIAVLCGLLGIPAVRATAQIPPLPETGFAGGGTPGTCIRTDPFTGEVTDPYGSSCVRLKFSLGPIEVQPGANSTYPMVKTIEKPWYDGYMVRIEPNMVLSDGETVPNVEDMHLHHATWLSYPEYGNGPFFAAGEEKTIAEYPVGYGMPVKATDVWYMVHMVHNATPQRHNVWITYTIDYIAKAPAETLGVKTIKPFWLDVWKNGRRASYPVYNSQKGFGQPITDTVTIADMVNPETGEPFTTTECTWPRDECGAFDSWTETDVGQGADGNGKGTDVYVPQNLAGTLIGIGGHLHPGGLRVEVDSVRCTEGPAIRPGNTISSWGGLACPDLDGDGIADEETARVFTSDAKYFDHKPFSWNFRMTVTGVPHWKVQLQAGTFLRINSVYETEIASWYEGMGIAVAYVAPGEFEEGALDPFEADIVDDQTSAECWASRGPNTLCTRGRVTKPTPIEYGKIGGTGESDWASTVPEGVETNDIVVGGFLYLPGDLSTASTSGVPKVKRDRPLTWWNADATANIYHTITACEYPCNGGYGIEYPLANFGYGRADQAPGGNGPVQYDSGELGYSPDFGPATGQLPPPIGAQTPDWARKGIAYSITPAEYNLDPGQTYTYFCRVHPFMRGSFEVVD
jgi:hypothetical protein